MNSTVSRLLASLFLCLGAFAAWRAFYPNQLADLSGSSNSNQPSESPPNDEPAPQETRETQEPEEIAYDVLVYGDELPGVCAALWAKKVLGPDGRVALLRPEPKTALAGGLVSRGGLAFLDLDEIDASQWQPYAQCWQELNEAIAVREACADPQVTDRAIRRFLADAGVRFISDVELQPVVENRRLPYADAIGKNQRFVASVFIDATQSARLARAAGLDYAVGFESQREDLADSTLAVSIVPVARGMTIDDAIDLEEARSQRFRAHGRDRR